MGRLQSDAQQVNTTNNNPLHQQTTPPYPPPPQPHHAAPAAHHQFSQQPNNIINNSNANNVGVSYYNNQPNMMVVPPGPQAQATPVAQYGGVGSVHGPTGGINMGMVNQVGGRPMGVPLSSPNTPGRMPTPNVYPQNSNQIAGFGLQGLFRQRPGGGGGRTGFVGTNAWTTGLFDCMDDPSNGPTSLPILLTSFHIAAFITTLFPCITFGQIADVLDKGHTTCVTSGIIYASAPCILSKPYRRKLRQMFGLVEAPAQDWIVHSMFEPCALCQEYRELKNRGIDPALGYHGNAEKLQKENLQAPTPKTPPKSQMMAQNY